MSAFLREAALGAARRARPGVVLREVVYRLSRVGLELEGLEGEGEDLGAEGIRKRVGVARNLLRAIVEELSR